MNKTSYKAKILGDLLAGETLDGISVLNRYGCFSLPPRIRELRQAGYPIQSRLVTTPNGKKHAIYWIDLASRQPTQ